MAGITKGPIARLVDITGATTQVLDANTNRNGIIFFNSTTTTTFYIVPGNIQAAVGQGIVVLPQFDYRLMEPLYGYGTTWNAIGAGGTLPATKGLLIMEFFGA